jgi:prevent-host-death family protein
MALIDVRELRDNTAEALRRVREEQAEYIITLHGRPTALLLPIDAAAAEAAMLRSGTKRAGDSWQHYARLAEQLRAAWPAHSDTHTLLDEMRREGVSNVDATEPTLAPVQLEQPRTNAQA